jgi:YesN/AraC family two-component response regulator
VLVALTGHGGLDYAQAAREAGFDHFLAKPCEAEQLRSLLRGDTPAAD